MTLFGNSCNFFIAWSNYSYSELFVRLLWLIYLYPNMSIHVDIHIKCCFLLSLYLLLNDRLLKKSSNQFGLIKLFIFWIICLFAMSDLFLFIFLFFMLIFISNVLVYFQFVYLNVSFLCNSIAVFFVFVFVSVFVSQNKIFVTLFALFEKFWQI